MCASIVVTSTVVKMVYTDTLRKIVLEKNSKI